MQKWGIDMNKLEELQEEAFQRNIDVIDYNFKSDRIKGLYYNGNIALSKSLEPAEKACVLAEELEHHIVNWGDIIDQKATSNRKQERHARLKAYDRMIGLMGIISAYKAHCTNIFEMAEYLEVSEAFLIEALETYRSKYGECTKVDNYVIYFEPYLSVFELI